MLENPGNLADRAMEVWEHVGLRCAIVPNPRRGIINGYVQLPEGDPRRALDYNDIEVAGLTYGSDPDGWVGFHTGELGDHWAPDDVIGFLDEDALRYFGASGIGRYALADHDPAATRWTIPKLKAEVERLAEQLSVTLRA